MSGFLEGTSFYLIGIIGSFIIGILVGFSIKIKVTLIKSKNLDRENKKGIEYV